MTDRTRKSYRIIVTTPQGVEESSYTSRPLANHDYRVKRDNMRMGTIELRMLPDGDLLRCDKVTCP